MANSLHMATLVVVGPRLLVGGVTRQQVVRGDEHRMGHGDDRLLMAAMPHHAPIPGREGALCRGRRPAVGPGCSSPTTPATSSSSTSGDIFPADPDIGPVLYEVIATRYEKKATLITSNKSLTEWGRVLHDTALAAALVDRLLHHGEVYYLKGDSYRLRGKARPAEAPPNPESAPEGE
jgi:hypothetical protein